MSEPTPAPLDEDLPPAATPSAPSDSPVSIRDLLLGVIVIWGFTVMTGTVLAIGMVVKYGMDSTAMADHPMPALLVEFFCLLLTAFVVWYFTCKKYGLSFSRGLKLGPAPTPQLVWAFGIGLAVALVAGTLMTFLAHENSMIAQMVSTREGLLIVCAFAVIVPPFEEIYYRGFVFPALRRTCGVTWAMAIVILWFGLVHAFQLFPDWAAMLVVTTMGAIYTVQRHVTGSLWPPIITHLTYNAVLDAWSLVAHFSGN